MATNIEEQAKKIAALVSEVDPDNRGNLFVLAGQQLQSQAQGFTGKLFLSIGMDYGVNPKQPGHPKFKG